MKQVYHPYWVWEDYLNGMWGKVSKKEEQHMLPIAIEFTGNHVLYGEWMMNVAKNWPISCEHNLTDTDQNRRAWIGHAAVSMAKNIPEYITRMAWGYLSKYQQDMANGVADLAIEWWLMKNGGSLYAKELFEL